MNPVIADVRKALAGERLLDLAGEVDFLFVGLVFRLELLGEIGGLALGFDKIGHIAGDAEGALDIAMAVAPGEFGSEHPGGFSLVPGFVFELAGHGLAGLKNAEFILFCRLPMAFIEEIAVMLADDFRGIVEAHPFGHALVGHHEAGGGILEIDMDGDVIDQLAQQETIICDLGLRLLAAADIDHGSGDAVGFAIAASHHGAADPKPAPISAAGADACIHGEGFRTAVLEGQRDGLRKGGPLIRMDMVVWGQKEVGGAVFSALEEFEDAAGKIDLLAVSPPIPDAFVGGSQREFEAFKFDRVAILLRFPVIIHSSGRMTVVGRGRKDEFGADPDFRPALLPGAAGAAWLCAVKRDPGNELLKGVSRSFYLSLRLLPEPMRGAASLGYLLARSSDTLADTPGTPVEARLLCLDWFARSLAGEEDIPRWPLSMLNAVGDPRERHLLEETGRLLTWLEKLPAAEAALVRDVVEVIIGGQQLDLERFGEAEAWNPVALRDDAELDDYTWRVAGCVGAFWTRLGFLTMGERFSKAPEAGLLDMGVSYGKGLQLVNILRDLPGDLKQGRCYLPVADAHDTALLLEAHGRWLERALDQVADGFTYAAELRSRKLRAASVLPAMIARDTLLKMRGADWPTLQAGVKVSRSNVYRSLLKAFASSGPR